MRLQSTKSWAFCFSAFRSLRSGSLGMPGSFFSSERQIRLADQALCFAATPCVHSLVFCGTAALWDSVFLLSTILHAWKHGLLFLPILMVYSGALWLQLPCTASHAAWVVGMYGPCQSQTLRSTQVMSLKGRAIETNTAAHPISNVHHVSIFPFIFCPCEQ